MENNLLLASVTLAQTFVDNMEGYDHNERFNIGENIIKFIYKWLGDNNDVETALLEYSQHNEDCRYECYCCGQCDDVTLDKNEPNVLDENIVNIANVLRGNREDNSEEEILVDDEN